jgi:hypothetical protein
LSKRSGDGKASRTGWQAPAQDRSLELRFPQRVVRCGGVR